MDQPRLLNANVNYWYYHGLFGEERWARLKTACCGSANANGDQCDFFWPLYNATHLGAPCVNETYLAEEHVYDMM